MRHDATQPTRKEFLLTIAGAALLPKAVAAQSEGHRLLIVVAHPDDEYFFAATTYRLARELGWTVDQVVITNGEAGYRYSSLAETFYGVPLSSEADARAHLPAIRQEELRRAGKILGIGKHYFLDQKDAGFATDATAADSSNWDRPHLRTFLSDLLARQHYDAVFTLLPTAQTHGHHRAATLLALECVSALPVNQRPLLFGADVRGKGETPVQFEGAGPTLVFDRTNSFGYRDSLEYRIVVDWVVAEHKSQGLFQMAYRNAELEEFWLLGSSGEETARQVDNMRRQLSCIRVIPPDPQKPRTPSAPPQAQSTPFQTFPSNPFQTK